MNTLEQGFGGHSLRQPRNKLRPRPTASRTGRIARSGVLLSQMMWADDVACVSASKRYP